MLHVRVDDELKAEVVKNLANQGLTVSDAVRILFTRVQAEGGLPVGLIADAEAYDAWFKAKVNEALEDSRPAISHNQVMQDAQDIIDRKRPRV
jgi:DNA-damage-inducible protein J